MRERVILTEDSIIKIPRGVRLQHDKTRDMWIVQAPERRFELDDIAAEVVKRVDSKTPIGAIADNLAETFDADRKMICADVLTMLQDFCDKGVLDA